MNLWIFRDAYLWWVSLGEGTVKAYGGWDVYVDCSRWKAKYG